MTQNIIAVDLGSNTIRFIKYSKEQQKFVNEYEEIVRTGENIAKTGKISENALVRVVTAIQNAKKNINFSDSEIAAVATASFRLASNRQEALETINKETGFTFRVLSSQDEAELTAKAVEKQVLNFGHVHPFLILDMGGASTELVYTDGKNRVYDSYDIGIVTYTESFASVDLLDERLREDRAKIEMFLTKIKEYEKPKLLASTAGTPTTLAAYKLGMDYGAYDKAKVNNTPLTMEDLKRILQDLKTMDQDTLEKYVGKNRGDLVITGIIIYLYLLKFLNFEETYVFDNSLREGVVYNLL